MKNKLTDEQVQSRAASIRKRNRNEWAQLCREAIVGRSVEQVAKLIGFSAKSVYRFLDLSAVNEAAGLSECQTTATPEDVETLVQNFAPSKPKAAYVQDYVDEGFEIRTAKKMATAYQAAETALERGAIKKTPKKQATDTRRLLFDKKYAQQRDFDRALAQLKFGVQTVRDANVYFLKHKKTLQQWQKIFAIAQEIDEQIAVYHDGD